MDSMAPWSTQAFSFGPAETEWGRISSEQACRQRAWAECLNALTSLSQLSQCPDPGEPCAPAKEVLQLATWLVQELASQGQIPPHRVVAGPEGEIVWEWYDLDGYTEVELASSGRIEWMHRNTTGEFTHWEWAVPPLQSVSSWEQEVSSASAEVTDFGPASTLAEFRPAA